MKVLVCGSRKWLKRAPIERELRKLPPGPETTLINGGAQGADAIATDVARELGFTVRRYFAQWGRYGKKAGPLRNSEMLEKEHLPEEPIDQVLAFADDFSQKYAPGTNDMLKKSRAKGIPVEPFSF